MNLTQAEQQKISAAIVKAEARTSGEIVCVLARSSSDYAALPLLWASFAGLLTPWLLIALTQLSVQRILLVQALVFGILLLFLSWPSWRAKLAPPAMRRAHAHRAAMEQFMIRGLSGTQHRTGVLIFVSLAEHYVRVVADEGVNAKVDQRDWQDTVDAMLVHLRNDRIADGFVVAIERCGAMLEQHFPAQANDRPELPDRIYLI